MLCVVLKCLFQASCSILERHNRVPMQQANSVLFCHTCSTSLASLCSCMCADCDLQTSQFISVQNLAMKWPAIQILHCNSSVLMQDQLTIIPGTSKIALAGLNGDTTNAGTVIGHQAVMVIGQSPKRTTSLVAVANSTQVFNFAFVDAKQRSQANLGFEPRFTDSESVVLTAIRIRHVRAAKFRVCIHKNLC